MGKGIIVILALYLEGRAPLRCGFLFVDSSHVRIRRALPQPSRQLRQTLRRSQRVYFHVAVIEIPHISAQSQRQCPLLGEIPVPHALDSSAYDEPSGNCIHNVHLRSMPRRHPRGMNLLGSSRPKLQPCAFGCGKIGVEPDAQRQSPVPPTRVATDLIEIDKERPEEKAVERAAASIRKGGVVAIPTEALYTLVADPLNLHAVGKVFQAKGRETQRSLPILVSDLVMAEELAKELTTRFFLLARHFWPGPLTLIVPASSKIPLKVTGNTGRLGLRQSRSAVVNSLLERMEQPLIATSANLSGEPTAKTGIEVFAKMDGAIDLVLDGGACEGEGATTVDVTEPYWKIIKEGAIGEKEIAACLAGQ